jgi:hypothetical protein
MAATVPVRAVFVGINYTDVQECQDLEGIPSFYAKTMMTTLTMQRIALYQTNECLFFSDKGSIELPAGVTCGKPTKENVLKALTEMALNARKGDVWLFYFCGHGANINGEGGALKTLNSDLSRRDVIYNNELEKCFESLDPSINVTFIIHACFSGAMFSYNPIGMKGIALASVGPTIPSIVRKEADTTDFTTYIRDKVIKKLPIDNPTTTDDSWPTYQQVYDGVKQIIVQGEMPDSSKTPFKGHAEIYHSSRVDPTKTKFLKGLM